MPLIFGADRKLAIIISRSARKVREKNDAVVAIVCAQGSS